MINKLLILFPCLVVVLAVAQFLISNDLASTGNSVYVVEQSIKVLREENEILKQQVARARSLAVIETRAETLGFFPATAAVTIPLYNNVALR
jgi:hypothetical protein